MNDESPAGWRGFDFCESIGRGVELANWNLLITMKNNFFSMLFGIIDFFTNRLANISIHIQDINTITNVNFLIMCLFKSLQFFHSWFTSRHSINTL